jgi:DNA polymerase-3 subunit alpha
MHLPEEKITLLCPRDHWSDGSESSLRRLREELGEANVVLKE